MNDVSKVAVIGCGGWGKNLVRNFYELGALAAVCDHNESHANAASAAFHVPVASIDAILNDKTIHGVIVATPPSQHFTLIKNALHAGKHVFSEKPVTLSLQEAVELQEVAQQENRLLMVGHVLQYHPAFIALKQLIARGELGKLQYIYSNRLNFGRLRTEENILWDLAPHDISMILSLTGGVLPRSVFSFGRGHAQKGVEDIVTTTLDFENGLQAHVFLSWLHPFKEQRFVVVGDLGMAVFEDAQPWEKKLCVYPNQVKWEEGMPKTVLEKGKFIAVPEAEPLKEECKHFLQCMVSGENPETDGGESVRVTQILDAAEQSLRSNQPVQLSAEKHFFQHDTAVVDAGAQVGEGTKIWHFSRVDSGAEIGRHCVIGQNVVIERNVTVGDKCKLQNNVSLFEGVRLGRGVFCGPSCVFANRRDAAIFSGGHSDTLVEDGVTIGANATIYPGVQLGAYAFVGAGSVVTEDIKPHALVVGNPAKQVGWVSHAGEKLGEALICPREGRRYVINKQGDLEAL